MAPVRIPSIGAGRDRRIEEIGITAQAEKRVAPPVDGRSGPRRTRRRYCSGEQRELTCVTVEAAGTWAARKAPRTLRAALPTPIETPH
jgi:hypothetical protein